MKAVFIVVAAALAAPAFADFNDKKPINATVTGETPIVDVQSAKVQNIVNKDILSAIPTSRNATGLQALIPGMATTGDAGLLPLPAMPPAAEPGPRSTQSFDLDRPLRDARDGFEKAYFEFHLAMENGSMTRVAEKTGLERTHLYRKLKQLGVDLSRGRRSAV